jgi:hypothetical protein
MFGEILRGKPSPKRMTLHVGRYATLPTINDVTALYNGLTGKDPPPEEMAEVQRILDEANVKEAAAAATVETAQNALPPLDKETTRDQIISALQRLTDEGGEHNFVILRADDNKNYYLQFGTSCGSAVIYGEAVGNTYLQRPFILNRDQRAMLTRLGWRPPTRKKFPNFYRWWPVINERDRTAIADVALETLESVYGWRSDPPLPIRLHLDW